MKKYIYENKYSISKELCDEIIKRFEKENNGKYEGITGGGLIKKIKNTIDFVIPTCENNNSFEEWNNIRIFLEEELFRNIKIYISSLSDNLKQKEENSLYYIFPTKYLINKSFQIQRYNKNEGKFSYHDDFKVDWVSKSYRVITFIWYLNDVNEGGETEIWDNELIKPEKGKLLLFPASWVYPHRGKIPISNDKYIITGWLYTS